MNDDVLIVDGPLTTTRAAAASHARAGDGLLHPIPLAAIALLLLNDHVFKAAMPGALTGKLSDLAGLVVLPMLVLAVAEVIRVLVRRETPVLGRRSAIVVVVVIGAAFAAMKLTPWGADAYRTGLGLLQWPFRFVGAAVFGGGAVDGPVPVGLVADPTDVVVLPILAVPLALTIARASAVRGRPETAVMGLAVDRFSLAVASLSVLLLIGAVVDGWAHVHQPTSLETILTPWHGLLYATSAVLLVLLAITWLTRWDGRSIRAAIPVDHGTTYAGAALYVLAGIGDGLWHVLFGIEADAEALVSPTHLLLGVGAGLIALGPVRAVLRRGEAGWSANLPAVLGIGAIAGLAGFATHIAHPLVDPWPLYPVARFPDPMWPVPNLGIASVGLQSAILAGAVVALHRVWPLPAPVALAAVILVAQAPVTVLHDRDELLVTVIVAATAIDLLGIPLRRRLGANGVIVLATLAPLAVFGLELVQLADRLRWSAHLLGGWLVVAGVAGGLVGAVAARSSAARPVEA